MSVLERPATGDPSGRGAAFASPEAGDELTIIEPLIFDASRPGRRGAVSYTHLTLPTKA